MVTAPCTVCQNDSHRHHRNYYFRAMVSKLDLLALSTVRGAEGGGGDGRPMDTLGASPPKKNVGWLHTQSITAATSLLVFHFCYSTFVRVTCRTRVCTRKHNSYMCPQDDAGSDRRRRLPAVRRNQTRSEGRRQAASFLVRATGRGPEKQNKKQGCCVLRCHR